MRKENTQISKLENELMHKFNQDFETFEETEELIKKSREVNELLNTLDIPYMQYDELDTAIQVLNNQIGLEMFIHGYKYALTMTGHNLSE